MEIASGEIMTIICVKLDNKVSLKLGRNERKLKCLILDTLLLSANDKFVLKLVVAGGS